MVLVSTFWRALTARDFLLLWLGSSVSLIGDGMTFVALTWLVLSEPGGTGRLGLFVVCYTLPVFVGGLAIGSLLDRFDKRRVLAADSLVRGAIMASIPIACLFGRIPPAMPFVAAGAYGLLKMVPLAGFPAAIPDLVPIEDLDAANAMESLGFGVAGTIGPALGGLAIPLIGAPPVLALDAVTYLLFAAVALSVRTKLLPEPHSDEPAPRLAMTALLRDPILVGTTAAFMVFNIAEGMLMVIGPWLAKTQLSGGAAALGLLLAALSVGEFIGAAAAGSHSPRRDPVRAISIAQVLAAAGFLGVLASPHTPGVAAGFLLIGLFSAPMTVWAQSVRMQRMPAELRGLGFAMLRTLMQLTPPIGASLAAPVVASERPGAAAVGMTVLAALPGLLLLRGAASRLGKRSVRRRRSR